MPEKNRNTPQKALPIAERRQLTVMFADIVGSTARANECDPEDFFEFIIDYQNMVRTCVAEYQGNVARFVGDGVLVFFGWPNAREDDAMRAIRAARKIVHAVTEIRDPSGEIAQCRVGIATGMVVVGEIATEGQNRQNEVFGEVPNLADRLQSLGRPGSVIVSEATRKLGEKEFDFVSVNSLTQDEKAKDTKDSGHEVIDEKSIARRFNPRNNSISRNTFGRQSELTQMTKIWELVKLNKGQICWICGEAGVGKSHIAHEIFRMVRTQHTALGLYQCSRFHMQNPYYFLVKRIESWAGILPADELGVRINKFENSIGSALSTTARKVILNLLGEPPDGREGEIIADVQHHEEIQQTMLEMLLAYTGNLPTVIIFDDLHWADPSSLDVVKYVCENIAEHPILILATHRPEIDFFKSGVPNQHLFEIGPLKTEATALMIDDVAGDMVLDKRTRSGIIEKTDGVPLFIESYTRAVVDAVRANRENSSFRGMVDVPLNLHDSLMERLDLLGDAKPIAQICAAIGRAFNAKLVFNFSDRSLADVEDCLNKLTRAGILNCTQSKSSFSYSFRHSLIQDAAYQGLLKRHRRKLHLDIAQTMVRDRPQLAESEPGFIAEHFRAAESYADALVYLLNSAKNNVRRFANREAMENADQAIVLTRRLKDQKEKERMELEFQLIKARASSAFLGFASNETSAAFHRILELAGKLGSSENISRAIRGLFNGLNAEGRYDDASKMAQRLIESAKGDPHTLMMAHHMRSVPLIWQGKFSEALTELSLSLEQHKILPVDSPTGTTRPPIQIIATLGIVQAYLGLVEDAKRNAKDALARAMQDDSPLEIANCYLSLCNVLRIVRDGEAGEIAAEFQTFLKDREVPYYAASVSAFIGLAKIQDGEIEYGAQLLRHSWEEFILTKSRLNQVFYLAELANSSLKLGKLDEAMRIIEEGFSVAEKNAERNFDAELYRIKAEIMAADHGYKKSEIVAQFEKAISRAKEQKARLFEIRARNNLAQYYLNGKNHNDAKAILEPMSEYRVANKLFRDLEITSELMRRLAKNL